jgi:low affinity Fe/Cu permease
VRKARVVAGVVMALCSMWLGAHQEWTLAALCLVLIHVFLLQNELEEMHDCLHKGLATIALLGNEDFRVKLNEQLDVLIRQNGQKSEDVVK